MCGWFTYMYVILLDYHSTPPWTIQPAVQTTEPETAEIPWDSDRLALVLSSQLCFAVDGEGVQLGNSPEFHSQHTYEKPKHFLSSSPLPEARPVGQLGRPLTYP